ncbi:phosphopantetheine-binding protein [Frankia sp. Cpl3]|uniref:phosphopantetheine-binding protein n=1 Tax=Parafrankia colletiae TaxID=573497 RepID=UPI0012FF676B|nr:phosphopantetheine-binding protein [Parafrankia colletiae]MCK9899593.1 phosphopantetheine-binding protein [Frankia sp. Cpl3]
MTEEALIQIWARVLDRPDIRAGDDFFQVGGHSLLAIRLVREIQAQLNVKISIRTLFRAPMTADLALVIDQASAER